MHVIGGGPGRDLPRRGGGRDQHGGEEPRGRSSGSKPREFSFESELTLGRILTFYRIFTEFYDIPSRARRPGSARTVAGNTASASAPRLRTSGPSPRLDEGPPGDQGPVHDRPVVGQEVQPGHPAEALDHAGDVLLRPAEQVRIRLTTTRTGAAGARSRSSTRPRARRDSPTGSAAPTTTTSSAASRAVERQGVARGPAAEVAARVVLEARSRCRRRRLQACGRVSRSRSTWAPRTSTPAVGPGQAGDHLQAVADSAAGGARTAPRGCLRRPVGTRRGVRTPRRGCPAAGRHHRRRGRGRPGSRAHRGVPPRRRGWSRPWCDPVPPRDPTPRRAGPVVGSSGRVGADRRCRTVERPLAGVGDVLDRGDHVGQGVEVVHRHDRPDPQALGLLPRVEVVGRGRGDRDRPHRVATQVGDARRVEAWRFQATPRRRRPARW